MAVVDTRTQDGLVVGRVAVRGDRLDPLCARLAIESALDGAELSLSDLPPDAIVCIRRLADPLPGGLRIDRLPRRPPRSWQSALARRIEALSRTAARPWLGPVPATAEAVRFDGRAELLACVARELSYGRPWDAWWYDELLQTSRDRAGLVRALVMHGEFVPSMMALLAERGEVVPFAAMLARAEAEVLTRALVERFALPRIMAVEERRAPYSVAVAPEQPSADVPLLWAPVAPETVPLRRTAAAAQELLVGLSLTLQRAPETTRRVPFTAHARALWGNAQMGSTAGESPGSTQTTGAVRPPRPVIGQSAGESVDNIATGQTTHVCAVEGERRGAPVGEAGPAGVERTAAPGTDAQIHEPGGERPASIVPLADDSLPSLSPPAQSMAPRSELVEVPRRFKVVHTRLGGLFFLINVGLALELYGDFTTPLSPGIDLSIWDFVALVGRELLGEDPGDDPVFVVLAQLAGRGASEPPGAGFVPPSDWRVPSPWIRPFRGESPWSWRVSDGRLVIAHPAGFCAVDVPAEGDAAGQAAREVAALDDRVDVAACAREPAAPASVAGDPLRRWLDRLMPYLRARLARAMPSTDRVEPGRRLCTLAATVRVSATHLDVVMSLAELSIDIRLSGLDRDPGWVPAAGRHIAFQFEV